MLWCKLSSIIISFLNIRETTKMYFNVYYMPDDNNNNSNNNTIYLILPFQGSKIKIYILK